jgi:hypothetical protein
VPNYTSSASFGLTSSVSPFHTHTPCCLKVTVFTASHKHSEHYTTVVRPSEIDMRSVQSATRHIVHTVVFWITILSSLAGCLQCCLVHYTVMIETIQFSVITPPTYLPTYLPNCLLPFYLPTCLPN